MQYYAPPAPYFAGDCMPFYHAGVYHLIYLRDENHHHALGGLGGHQWEHFTSTDLLDWQPHPLLLRIDAEWEKSICTGAVFVHDGVFYAFYATRLADWREQLCVATSSDGVHFEKSAANPFMTPAADYRPNHFRDPFVFATPTPAGNEFHMLVTAALTAADQHGRGGCLAHLVSRDLAHWSWAEPFIIPGYTGVPECPDYFEWNGWYYLLFSIHGVAHYRMSRHPLGPWHCPPTDTLDGPMARVMKTAPFTGNRRIGVAFLASLRDQRDDGEWLYAGNLIFRELVQHEDGTLGTRFVPEMQPAGRPLIPESHPLTPHIEHVVDEQSFSLNAGQSYEEVLLSGLPRNVRMHLRITPQPGSACYGVGVRGVEDGQRYSINLLPHERKVDVRTPRSGDHDEKGGHTLYGVTGLEQPTELEVVLHDDIIDVCINQQRCLVNRLPELQGAIVTLFCHNGAARVEVLRVVAEER
jgi:hypothetical protein